MISHPFLDGEGPIAIAHRGGAKEAPENSIEAFRHATNLGYRYLETDAQLTADGVVIAFHDSTIDRVSTQRGKIGDWRWEDLSSVEIGGSSRLTTVADLLAEFPDTCFNLDAKSDRVLAPLLSVIERANAFDRVCIGSFSDKRLRRARRMAGERLCTSLGPAAIIHLIARSRGLGSSVSSGQAVQVPVSFRGLPVITPRLVEQSHREGLVVHAWTIDDPEQMHRLLELEVDGIMTDAPTVLRDVMRSRGLW